MSELEEQRKKKISELCKKSLLEKWFQSSKMTINCPCPFCDDDKNQSIENNDYYNSSCKYCLCPPEICNNNAESGYVQTLLTNYRPFARVSELSKEDFDKIESLFKKYIIN